MELDKRDERYGSTTNSGISTYQDFNSFELIKNSCAAMVAQASFINSTNTLLGVSVVNNARLLTPFLPMNHNPRYHDLLGDLWSKSPNIAKDHIKCVVRDFILSKKNVIAEAYRTNEGESFLEYALVPSGDETKKIKEHYHKFLDFYESSKVSEFLPIYFHIVPASRAEKIRKVEVILGK